MKCFALAFFPGVFYNKQLVRIEGERISRQQKSFINQLYLFRFFSVSASSIYLLASDTCCLLKFNRAILLIFFLSRAFRLISTKLESRIWLVWSFYVAFGRCCMEQRKTTDSFWFFYHIVNKTMIYFALWILTEPTIPHPMREGTSGADCWQLFLCI